VAAKADKKLFDRLPARPGGPDIEMLANKKESPLPRIF
jgi:hypothetical protein